MKALVFTNKKEYTIEDRDIPEIGSREVLVKVYYAGLCGTDLHILNGDFPSDFPVIPCHEFTGKIVNIGSEVTSVKTGDKVVVNPVFNCGKCYYCINGMENYCKAFKCYGGSLDGGFAQYASVHENNVYKLDTGIDLREAALLEPLACALYGISKINIRIGDTALIFGIGTMGLLMLQILKNIGISQVAMIDVNNRKFEKAKLLGADSTFLNDKMLDKKIKSLFPQGFNILIDATGIKNICQQIFNYYTVNSSILLYGVCKPEEEIKLKPYDLYSNDLTVCGAFSFTRDKLINAIKMLRFNMINLGSLISHEFKIEDFKKSMEILKRGEAIKIVFNLSND